MSIQLRYISIILGSLLSISSMAGVIENEWFSPNKGRKLALLQYLAFKPPLTSSSGPITIYADQLANLGYVAYAKTLSEIIRDKFPQQKLRVIIKYDHSDYEDIVGSFRFHPDVEVLLLSKSDKLHGVWAEEYLEEASLIFTFGPIQLNTESRQYFYIDLVQIGFTNERSQSPLNQLSDIIEEYRQFMDLDSDDESTVSNFKYNFFRARIDWSVSEIEQHPNISDTSVLPEMVAQEIINERLKKHTSQLLFSTKGLKKITHSRVDLGLSPLSAGTLVSPLISELSQSTKMENTFQLPAELVEEEAELAAFLKQYAYSQSGGYRFYMSYMHNLLKIVEYIATVSYLEPDTIPIILVNFGESITNQELFSAFIARFGIAEVHLTDLKENRTQTIRTTLPKGRSVHLVQIPKIQSEQAYGSLFALSQNPVGVTGNQSLFMAIALGKIPLYDINLDTQKETNAFLASFDESGLLSQVFSNSINPQQKASLISEHENLTRNWSRNILSKKMANDLVETYIRLTLSPDPEIERLLLEINHLFDAGIYHSDNAIVHDVVLIKRFYEQINKAIELDQSIYLPNFWQTCLIIFSQLRDPDVRRWFSNNIF